MKKLKLIVKETSLGNHMKKHSILLKNEQGNKVFESHLTNNEDEPNFISSHFFGIEDDIRSELDHALTIDDLNDMWSINTLYVLSKDELEGKKEEVEDFMHHIDELKKALDFHFK